MDTYYTISPDTIIAHDTGDRVLHLRYRTDENGLHGQYMSIDGDWVAFEEYSEINPKRLPKVEA